MGQTDPRLLLLHPDDNVLVLRGTIAKGETISVEGGVVEMPATIGMGHKLARLAIRRGDKVLKHGAPIGSATADIPQGAHVHLSNLKSDYTPTHSLDREALAEGADRKDTA